MHDGPELDERRREDDRCASDANTATDRAAGTASTPFPSLRAIPAWLSASFASVTAAACGGGTDSAADAARRKAPRTPPTGGTDASRPTPAPLLQRIADTVSCSVRLPTPAPHLLRQAIPRQRQCHPRPQHRSPAPAPAPSPSPSIAAPPPRRTDAPRPHRAPRPAAPITPRQASRFLAQASIGATRQQIARVQTIGYSAWLDEQIALPRSSRAGTGLMAAGYTPTSSTATARPASTRRCGGSSSRRPTRCGSG